MTTMDLIRQAKAASIALRTADSEKKNAALEYMAEETQRNKEGILAANREDVSQASGLISEVMIDRLSLNEARIDSMAEGIRQVAKLPDPVGRCYNRIVRPNGLVVEKMAVPLGVIGIIYESRPNVTSDAAALCVKSGNACVLRCGREAWKSANAITEALKGGLEKAGLPETAVCLVQDTSRQSANDMMTSVGFIDLLIPRGGAGLIRACTENAKVPCIQTGTGVCHIYVDVSADLEMALNILENAKTSRPSVCNAAEKCLVHETIAPVFLPRMRQRLVDERIKRGQIPVEFRTDARSFACIGGTPATEQDFSTEYLDYILGVKVVKDLEEAVEHIARYGTGHSECIVTQDEKAAEAFVAGVDCAAVYVNASTRFTDGGEFGLGCEMGISTQKLHARGPMGLQELTTYKYVVRGNGQIRE